MNKPQPISRMSNLIAAVMNAAAAKLMPKMSVNPSLPQFAGQHTNPRRNEERLILRSMGKRQYKKMQMRSRGV